MYIRGLGSSHKNMKAFEIRLNHEIFKLSQNETVFHFFQVSKLMNKPKSCNKDLHILSLKTHLKNIH